MKRCDRALGVSLAFLLLAGCGTPVELEGTVDGQELPRGRDGFYARYEDPEAAWLVVMLGTYADLCEVEAERRREHVQALEDLQTADENATTQEERSAALEAQIEAVREANARAVGAGGGWKVRLDLPLDDDEALGSLDGHIEELGGGGSFFAVCELEDAGDTVCFPATSGQLQLEVMGSRLRGEGRAEVSELDDPDDVEGEVELFFDVAECEGYGPLESEFLDEYERTREVFDLPPSGR